jgi:hypothetical protein
MLCVLSGLLSRTPKLPDNETAGLAGYPSPPKTLLALLARHRGVLGRVSALRSGQFLKSLRVDEGPYETEHRRLVWALTGIGAVAAIAFILLFVAEVNR